MTRTISLHIPRRVSKHLPNVPERITVPSVSLPHLSLARLPEEARRPIYATVGAGDLAVERVREAATAVQERITGAQKSLTEKAGDLSEKAGGLSEKAGGIVGDNIATATSTYDEFTRRGAKLVERFWPAAAATEQTAPAAVVAVPKAAPKTPAKTRKSPAKPAVKPAAKRAVKVAPKNVTPRNVAPKSTSKNTTAKPVTKRVPKPAADSMPASATTEPPTSAPTAAQSLKSVQE